MPGELGINMMVKRVNLMSAGECVLSASFRLPVEAPFVMPGNSDAAQATSSSKRQTAIVPITLLLTGSVDRSPQVIRLRVPSYTPVTTEGAQTVATGHFTLDLWQMANLGVTPQTFFIYAFSGPLMIGPVPTAFVSLPPMAEVRSTNG